MSDFIDAFDTNKSDLVKTEDETFIADSSLLGSWILDKACLSSYVYESITLAHPTTPYSTIFDILNTQYRTLNGKVDM